MHRHGRWQGIAAAAITVGLASCGGGGGGDAGGGGPGPITAEPIDQMPEAVRIDVVRLAQQATFGPTESVIADIRTRGHAGWIAHQMTLAGSRYTSGQGDAIHRNTTDTDFCSLPTSGGENCWRDWYSTEPLVWDFYRNAIGGADQLRQRVALALQQVLVVSNFEVYGTYGFRRYYNNLLENAFGNYRDVLRRVTLSPVMGEYLDHVNNDKTSPNENFARELLQLFSIGTCALDADGSLTGGRCTPTYDNEMVRRYAYALTGWTYPAGGVTSWGCWPEGANCQHLGGDMVPAPALRNDAAQSLLSGVSIPAGASASAALEKVLDSLMQHPNTAPFVSRRLIQHLVRSNPSPAYVGRVAAAFVAGTYSSGGSSFGTGSRGDLGATVAAVLLDAEARRADDGDGGQLREPILHFTGALRALNGRTDGAPLGWWWGEQLRQHVFMPPSVFNFTQPDYPVAGTTLVGPEFGIHNANSALERLNYLTYLLDWGGSDPDPNLPGATGTRVDLTALAALADRPEALVDRLAFVSTGRALPAAVRQRVIEAAAYRNEANSGADWRVLRAADAAWLVLASPQVQVRR